MLLHARHIDTNNRMDREDDMTKINRRGVLQTAGLMTIGAIAGCASPREGGNAKEAFSVAQPTLPIVGTTERFPVRRIYCIGRNYAAHAREMGSDPTREPPFFFQKPSDAVQFIAPGVTTDHPYPTLTKNYHYEIELVAAINKRGKNIPIDQALQYVFGYAVGLDMTRRDLQNAAKAEGKPWEIGKSFDKSAPIGPLHPVASIGHFTEGAIWLKVNGQIKQSANLQQMIWSVAEQISKLSEAFELMPGDIVYSGTPANVGPVVRGDIMEGHIDRLPNLSVRVV